MKHLLTIFILLLSSSGVFAQTAAVENPEAVLPAAENAEGNEPETSATEAVPDDDDAASAEPLPDEAIGFESAAEPSFDLLERDETLRHFAPKESVVPEIADPFTAFNPLVDEKDFEPPPVEKFHWKPAIAQSMIFLGIQHGSRLMAQPKTRRGLKGRFFKDWGNSIKGLRGWDDGGIWFTNYVAHPLQGGVTGHIFVNNSDRARRARFGNSKLYWETRFKAFVWSALWSAQFEIGPISEASIGNVGMTLNKKGKTGMAWVDLVVTPVGGTAVLIVEDAIDKYVLENWIERNTTNRTKIKILRTLLNPTRSFSNVLRWKAPWKRDRRSF